MLYTLLVADIGKHLIKNSQLGVVKSGDMQDVYKRQEYMYAFLGKNKGEAITIFRVTDPEKALHLLKDEGIHILTDTELLAL